MLRSTLPLALMLALSPSFLQAQVSFRLEFGLPVPPPLVEVETGVHVMEDFREEVFFHDGWYWCRRPNGWYRAHSLRGRYDWVRPHHVPGVLARRPVGHYRYWHHDDRRDAHVRHGRSGHGRQDHEDGESGHRRGKGRRPLYPYPHP